MSALMTVHQRSTAPVTDTRLRAELWRQIRMRLAGAEALATHGQLLAAIESAYRQSTGQVPSADMRRHLDRLVRQANDEEPETYLAVGVQNAVQQAFARGVEHLHWEAARVEQRGTASIKRFLRRHHIRHFLDEIQLDPALIDVVTCVRHGVIRARSAAALGALPGGTLQDEDLDAAQLLATIQAGLKPIEARRRLTELERFRQQLHERITGQLADSIDTYVDDGALSVEDADGYLANLRTGSAVARPGVADAVASTVACLQIFKSLQRIRDEYDGLFRTLIQHKELVVSGDEGDRTQLMTALMRSPGFQALAVAVMGRRDPELRLLAARAAPYDRLTPGQPDGELAIDVSFLDDLRRLSAEDYGHRLFSPDRSIRAAARSNIREFILLVDRLIEATPLRRKVRLLIANQILTERTPEIEALYRTSADTSDARRQAERLLNQQLRPVFVEASKEESEAARRRRRGVLMAVEQQLAS